MNSRMIKLGLATTALALVLSGCSTPEEKAESYYKSGQAYLDKKDYAHASVEFRNALKVKKDYPDGWFAMAQIEEHEQNWPAVVGDLQKVIELDPNYIKAYQALARLFLASGNLAEALKNANLANDKAPNTPESLILKAVALYKLQDTKGAAEINDKVLAINPDFVDALTLRGTLQADAGDDAGALATIEKALSKNDKAFGLYLVKLKLLEKQKNLVGQEQVIRDIVAKYPDHPEYTNILISFLANNGRSAEAEQELRKKLAANPKDKIVGMQLVGFLAQIKGAAAARAELEKLAAEPGATIDYQLQLANLDYTSGKKEEAYARLRTLANQLQISDDGIAARIDLAGKLLDDSQLAEAEKWITEILKNDSANQKGLKLKGGLELAKGNFDTALETLRLAQNGNTKDADVHILLGSVYEKKGSFDLATSEFTDAFRLSSGDPRVGANFAGYLLRRGNLDRADEVLSEAVSRAPKNLDLVKLLADVKLQRQDWQGAEALAKMVKEGDGNQALSSEIMGSSLMAQKRFDEAISFFRSSAETAPENVQPMFALVRSYLGAGKTKEAEDFVDSVLKANPNNAPASILKGNVDMAANRPADAQKSFESAVQIDPTLAPAYLALAQYFFSQKKVDQGIATLEAGVPKVKSPEGLQMALGQIYEGAKDYNKAMVQYEAVIEKNPKSLAAINNYASLVSDFSTDQARLQHAADLAKGLENSPIPQFRETFGWITAQTGDAKAGLQVLEQTITKLDAFSLAHYHLGVAYGKAGDKTLAQQHLEKAIAMEKDPAMQEKFKSALAAVKG